MKRFVLLFLVLCVATTGVFAQKSDRKERRSERYSLEQMELNRIWKKRAGYLNISYVKQSVENELTSKLNLNSDWGASISWGRTFYLHKKPIGRVLKFGLDWTWLDINGAGYSDLQDYDEYDQSYVDLKTYQAEIGMQFGPSITVNPVHHLKIGAYFRVTPCYSAIYVPDYEAVWGNYATFFNVGGTIAWKVLSVGVEYRKGSAKYKSLIDDDIDIVNMMGNFNTNSMRFYFGFRF